jgi:GDPmannose 4,6-dehydratase
LKALITGITGQDGSYLADLLLEKGYEVHGIIRRVSTPNISNIEHLLYSCSNINNSIGNKFIIHEGDITDISSLLRVFKKVQPKEIYNLAAQSFVGSSWNQPILTCNVTGIGALNVFEAARQACPQARIYQASSSEMFGGDTYPQNEQTIFKPRSPYGVAKLFAHNMARVYRESHGMYISCGILFNHESPRRGIEFVTQKIVTTAVEYYFDNNTLLEIGNPYAQRDWSHAKDMVRGMWMMLQQDTPDDFIMSSGETHSVKEFIDYTYKNLNIDLEWFEHKSDKEFYPYAVDKLNGKIVVKCVPKFYRPNEVNVLLGKTDKAKRILGWMPEFTFNSLIEDMVMSKRLGIKNTQ